MLASSGSPPLPNAALVPPRSRCAHVKRYFAAYIEDGEAAAVESALVRMAKTIPQLDRRTIAHHTYRFWISAKNAFDSRAKSDSVNSTLSPGFSFSTDFSGGRVNPETRDIGHPLSRSTCSRPLFRTIELLSTRTSLSGLPSLPSRPESRCSNMYSSFNTRLLKNVVSSVRAPDCLNARTSAAICALHDATYAFS